MKTDTIEILRNARLESEEQIASLWSGYGEIIRQIYILPDESRLFLIKKQVSQLIPISKQPDESQSRKAISYVVERYFYDRLSRQSIDNGAHLPRVYATTKDAIYMTDLGQEYPVEHVNMDHERSAVVIRWLAHYHVQFWNYGLPAESLIPLGSRSHPDPEGGQGVWEEGGYWPLHTRQAEYELLDSFWKRIAVEVDAEIRAIPAQFTTLMHGDLKSANIVFSEDLKRCAVFDFQYVGIGPGIRDLVYFMISSVHGLDRHVSDLLRLYHQSIIVGLKGIGLVDVAAEYTFETMIKQYELCLVDYYRFMLGWVYLPSRSNIDHGTLIITGHVG